ncbi:MAG: hypothetical protein R2860_07740 [Desulfobacterales bacterium]
MNQPLNLFRDMDVLFSRQVIADGEAWPPREFIISVKATSQEEKSLRLEESFSWFRKSLKPRWHRP